jgi:hypothetical protein
MGSNEHRLGGLCLSVTMNERRIVPNKLLTHTHSLTHSLTRSRSPSLSLCCALRIGSRAKCHGR